MAKETELTAATTLAERASKPYPNDSAEYRRARTALLAEEIELRRHIERVAVQRRALPPGGAVPEDYVFTAEGGAQVRFSDLFGGRDTLVTYTWMFGPGEMGDGTQDPGEDPRGAPDLMPMWNIFDLTPAGRAPEWYPKLAY